MFCAGTNRAKIEFFRRGEKLLLLGCIYHVFIFLHCTWPHQYCAWYIPYDLVHLQGWSDLEQNPSLISASQNRLWYQFDLLLQSIRKDPILWVMSRTLHFNRTLGVFKPFTSVSQEDLIAAGGQDLSHMWGKGAFLNCDKDAHRICIVSWYFGDLNFGSGLFS